jgi:tetratricopeptide (TPR) repeat protein
VSRADEIRRRVARDGAARPEDVDEIDDLLDAEGVSVELLVLRGQLIQLVAFDDPEAQDEALSCYRDALELDPGSAIAHEELAHFLDDVADEPAEAARFFRKAIALGAGETAEAGLREAESRLADDELAPLS